MILKIAAAVSLMLILAGDAHARCGRCHRPRHCRAPLATRPVYPTTMAYPTTSPPPMPAVAAPAATVFTTPAAPVVAQAPTPITPTYQYAPEASGRPAYYYTYNGQGKLVVQEWMDWLFRGGKEAGEPHPPWPVLGGLRRDWSAQVQ